MQLNCNYDCEKTLTQEELNGSSSSLSSSASSLSSSYPASLSAVVSSSSQSGMCARAVLTCRPNSHPFQDRTVSLEQPVKIGRSVARARPATNNAIFDCKVLSRNHALLWYETGKFYLQDTKSSNGTFVNNQRLSKSSEESPPREVCSGDILQFGVDVMEVNKKVTHGCIVATLQLFLPDGKEAKASSSTILLDKAATTSVHEIYQLNQFIKDAMQREQLLENKLATVNKLMASTKEAVESSWKALIEEDRLLTRVDILERQLQASHKTMTDDKLREEVVQLNEDKEKYQSVAKEALRKAMQEKMEALKKYHELEKNINNTEEEKGMLKDMCDRNCQELKDLAEKYEQVELKSKELVEEIDQSSAKYKEEVENLNKRMKDGENVIHDKQKVIEALIAKVDSQVARTILAAHNEDTNIIISDNKLSENENELDQENDNLNETKIRREEDDESIPESNDSDYNMNIPRENPVGEVETLKGQLRVADGEKKEIQTRLSQLLNLFEEIKTVSNKVQVSEYLAELMRKLDMEIKQIKNFTQGEETLRNNSYSISDEDSGENKLENHLSRHNSDGVNGLEKLLEESRQTVKSLQVENVTAKRQSEDLQEKFGECAIQLENYKLQLEALSEVNSELQSQIGYMQDKMDNSERNRVQDRLKLEAEKEAMVSNAQLIDKLKGEMSALESLLKERDERISQLLNQLNDLNVDKPEPILLEIACQTLEDVISAHKVSSINNAVSPLESSITHGGAVHIGKNDNSIDNVNDDVVALTDKLLQTEEELAIYKDRYNECSTEKTSLSRMLNEMKLEHETLANQSKLVFYCCSLPVLILLIAIVMAFYPTLSVLTATKE